MEQKVRAIYRVGVFVLQEPCDVTEESEVELIIQGPLVLSPEVTGPVEKACLLKIVAERVQQNPIPAGVPCLTREELHEHRRITQSALHP
jgi:hypothetical protein